MKVYVNAPNENWILDRYKKEWCDNHLELSTDNPLDADLLWMLDSYTWMNWNPKILAEKKVVSTITHIAPEKFDYEAFKYRDQFVDHYQAMCDKSAEDVRKLTNKPVTSLKFWVNENIWKPYDSNYTALRSKYNLPIQSTLFGSFQRDTEGHDLKSPKLVKGPDILCDYLEYLKSIDFKFSVVLSGWRRQYVMNRLDNAGIPYYYFEMCDFDILNELYNCLDLYIVSSRREGGPQAISECAMTKTPIISTDVGLASDILAPESVNDDLKLATPNLEYAYKKVQKYTIKNHMQKFVDLFIDI